MFKSDITASADFNYDINANDVLLVLYNSDSSDLFNSDTSIGIAIDFENKIHKS